MQKCFLFEYILYDYRNHEILTIFTHPVQYIEKHFSDHNITLFHHALNHLKTSMNPDRNISNTQFQSDWDILTRNVHGYLNVLKSDWDGSAGGYLEKAES